MTVKKGIDVSKWQGVIDWDKVKAQGIDFVMLRAGYGQNNIDEQFVRNADECTRLGIPFGVYWFSYAGTVERARQEAKYCIEAIKPYRIEYPIAFDFEYDSVDYLAGKGITTTKKLASDMARAFLEKIEAAGHYPMLYTNADYLARYFDGELAAKYDIWLAQWPKNPDPEKPPRSVGIWQYSNVGRVPGIVNGKGNVDMNAAYKDYPALIAEMEGYKVVYHTREEIKEKADWGLATFDKLVNNGYLKGVAENDYNVSDEMLRVLVILDRAGAFSK